MAFTIVVRAVSTKSAYGISNMNHTLITILYDNHTMIILLYDATLTFQLGNPTSSNWLATSQCLANALVFNICMLTIVTISALCCCFRFLFLFRYSLDQAACQAVLGVQHSENRMDTVSS